MKSSSSRRIASLLAAFGACHAAALVVPTLAHAQAPDTTAPTTTTPNTTAPVAPALTTKEKTKTVGGAAMYPSKNIIENAVNSKDHTTLVAAVQAAGLADTLSGPGPFTVFAPTNEAFAKLPAGTVDNLLKPENKDQLSSILTYHVLAGKYSLEDIKKQLKVGNGKVQLKTVQGEMLTFTKKKKKIVITDAKGGTSTITIPDVDQSNGVIHVVDTVLMP